MAVKAILEIEGKKLNILEFNYKINQTIDKVGIPSGNPLGGIIILTLESDKDTMIYDWTLGHDVQKDGKITFYNQDGISKFKEIKFQEAYCILHNEKFTNNGKFPMKYTIEISPGNANYQGSNFTKNWSNPVIDQKNASTFVKEEEDKEKRTVLNFTATNSEVTEGKFGYDNFDEFDGKCTSDKNKLKQEYKPIQVYGNEYVPVWVSMRKGQTITLKIDTSRNKNPKLFDEIKFVDNPDFTFEPKNLKGVSKVNITCNNTNSSTAQIKVEADGVVAGAINFFYPEPKKVDLRWIVVDFNVGDKDKIRSTIENDKTLKDYFKKAFNPALIDINIVNGESEILDLTKTITDKAEIKFVAGIRKHIEEGSKDRAKGDEEERKALMSNLKSLHTVRNKDNLAQNELTLLLTNLKCIIPVADSEEGGSNNGITLHGVSLMFLGNDKKFPKQEIPHEIMHSIGLEHTFKEKNDTPTSKKHTYTEKSTPNYMDYEGDQNRTFYWQWEKMYNSSYSK